MKINFVITIKKENMKMIKGIDILATNKIYTCADWCIIELAISIIISLIFIMIFIIEKRTIEKRTIFSCRAFCIMCMIDIICIIVFMVCCIKYNHSKLDHVEYQVTISNDVPIVEFNSKYEIVNQNGKIYTIKEKEN